MSRAELHIRSDFAFLQAKISHIMNLKPNSQKRCSWARGSVVRPWVGDRLIIASAWDVTRVWGVRVRVCAGCPLTDLKWRFWGIIGKERISHPHRVLFTAAPDVDPARCLPEGILCWYHKPPPTSTARVDFSTRPYVATWKLYFRI